MQGDERARGHLGSEEVTGGGSEGSFWGAGRGLCLDLDAAP